jgi:hypothetical protein
LISINHASSLINRRDYSGLLICGDFNFSMINWNDENLGTLLKFDESATAFLNCLNETFISQNAIKPTFQVNASKVTNTLDLILTESCNRIFMLEHSPPLGNIEHGHHILDFKYSYINNHCKEEDYRKTNFSFNKGDYQKFDEYISEFDWEKEFKDLNANDCYIKWLTFYENGCKMFIPQIKSNNKRRKPPWLTNDLKNMFKDKKDLWYENRNSKFKNVLQVQSYKKICKLLKKLTKKAITEYERNLAKNSKVNPKRVYAYINSKTKIKDTIRALKKTDGNIATDGQTISNLLNDYFSSVFTKEDLKNVPIFEHITDTQCLSPKFDERTIESKLKNLNINKSCGVDGVHPRVLKECS